MQEEPSEDERIVLFEWRKPANDVQLVGSFNDWTPERMTKRLAQDNTFSVLVPVCGQGILAVYLTECSPF